MPDLVGWLRPSLPCPSAPKWHASSKNLVNCQVFPWPSKISLKLSIKLVGDFRATQELHRNEYKFLSHPLQKQRHSASANLPHWTTLSIVQLLKKSPNKCPTYLEQLDFGILYAPHQLKVRSFFCTTTLHSIWRDQHCAALSFWPPWHCRVGRRLPWKKLSNYRASE